MGIANWYTKMPADLAKEAKGAGRKGDGRGAVFSAYQVLSATLSDAVDHELIDIGLDDATTGRSLASSDPPGR